MSVFSKNIAVIKTLRQGFSANGEELSGIIKCEKYATRLKVEISYINFAPLSEGRFVCAVSDGKRVELVENGFFEGESEINTANGFCAMICFVHKGVLPIAAAVCGNYSKNLADLPNYIAQKEKIIKGKNSNQNGQGGQGALLNKDIKNDAIVYDNKDAVDKKGNQDLAKNSVYKIEEKSPYDDEAIAEDDYFEYDKTDKGSGTFKQNKAQKKDGATACDDETNGSSVQNNQNKKAKGALIRPARLDSENLSQSNLLENIWEETRAFATGKSFYEEVKDEVERVLSSFPKEKNLCNVVQNSRWVKINYGDNKFYVFGVIYSGNNPEYLCYGVPTKNAKSPPQSLKGMATFIPAERDKITSVGYWVTYQSALTGASVRVEEA